MHKDIAKNGANDGTLRSTYEVMFIMTEFKVPCSQAFSDKASEATIRNFCLNNTHESMVINTVKAFANVTLNNSSARFKSKVNFLKGTVASTLRSKPMRGIQKSWFKHSF